MGRCRPRIYTPIRRHTHDTTRGCRPRPSRARGRNRCRRRCTPRTRNSSITSHVRPTVRVVTASPSRTNSICRTCRSASVAEPRIGGATRVVAVLGWPVAHSLSPVIHNAAFDALGMDWTYVALPVQPASVPAAVAGLGAPGIAGANVTMPHKEAVADAMDELTEDAERLCAVNTIELRGDRLVRHTTVSHTFIRVPCGEAGVDAGRKT